LNNESWEKLVWGQELYVDSTQVNANADLDSLAPREAGEAREAMQAHLAALFSEENAQHKQQETVLTPQVEKRLQQRIQPSPCLLRSQSSSVNQSERNSPKKMPLGTTRSPSREGLRGKFAGITSAPPTCGSAPLILMPRRCV
jgi:hypothetical protein